MLTDGVWAAVPSELAKTTLKTILASPAAKAVAGTASAPAVALAESVLHTMHWMKLKVVLTVLLTRAALAGGVGLLIHQSGAAKAPSPSKVVDSSQEAEEMPLPASRWKYRMMDLKLKEGVVVMTDPAQWRKLRGDATALETLQAEAYTAAHAKADKDPGHCKAGDLPTIVSVGPPLEREEQAMVTSLIRQGNRLLLEVIHTSPRPAGTPPREKFAYRPLVDVPVDLAPGTYQLTATWQAVTALTGGKLHKTPPATHEYTFVIVDNLAVSPPMRVEGLDFETLIAKEEVLIPPAGQEKHVNVGLRIHNSTDKEVILSNYLEDLVPVLRCADGTRWSVNAWRRGLRAYKPVLVPAHRRTTYWQRALLSSSADGKTLQLHNNNGSSGWRSADLKPGKYDIYFEYENDRQILDDRTCWMGKVQTKPVSLSLVAPK